MKKFDNFISDDEKYFIDLFHVYDFDIRFNLLYYTSDIFYYSGNHNTFLFSVNKMNDVISINDREIYSKIDMKMKTNLNDLISKYFKHYDYEHQFRWASPSFDKMFK